MSGKYILAIMILVGLVSGMFALVRFFSKIILAGRFKHPTSRSKMAHDEEYQDDLTHSSHLLHCADIF